MTILDRRRETLQRALLQVPVHETRVCILTQPGYEPEDAEVMLIGFPWSHEFLTGALVDLAARDTAAFAALVDWSGMEAISAQEAGKPTLCISRFGYLEGAIECILARFRRI